MVLATSRERLGVDGERVIAVRSLDMRHETLIAIARGTE
jgi:hypothetical protein